MNGDQKGEAMKRIVLFALVFAACTSRLTYVDTLPPGNGGAVRGIVTDDGGHPLPGVTVTLTKPSGKQTVVTDAAGRYQFAGVAPGTYPLEIELTGFPREAMRIRVVDAKTLRLKTEMRSAVSESITVTAQAPMGTAGGIVSGVMSAKVQGVAAPPSSYVQEPPSTAEYAHIAENGFIETNKERTTTFSIYVDGASYTNVRRFLTSNLVPPPDAVRVEEMINYFTYNYAPPADGRPFSVATEVAGCPWEPNHRLLRIGIQGKKIDQWKVSPNNLVFLLDVSGSMAPPPRLPLLKSAFRLLVEQLRAEDSVAIVVYAGAAGVAL